MWGNFYLRGWTLPSFPSLSAPLEASCKIFGEKVGGGNFVEGGLDPPIFRPRLPPPPPQPTLSRLGEILFENFFEIWGYFFWGGGEPPTGGVRTPHPLVVCGQISQSWAFVVYIAKVPKRYFGISGREIWSLRDIAIYQ